MSQGHTEDWIRQLEADLSQLSLLTELGSQTHLQSPVLTETFFPPDHNMEQDELPNVVPQVPAVNPPPGVIPMFANIGSHVPPVLHVPRLEPLLPNFPMFGAREPVTPRPITPPVTSLDHDFLAGFRDAIVEGISAAAHIGRGVTPEVHSSGESKSLKLGDPEKFTGKSRSALYTWQAVLEMHLRANPRKFDTEEKKVLFAGSHLTGPALSWFSSHYLNPDSLPYYMEDYTAFQNELQRKFGERDRQNIAEKALNKLRMPDNWRVTRYTTDFDTHAFLLSDWSDRPLRKLYWEGLAPRVQRYFGNRSDPIPTTLETLKDEAEAYDANYWEVHTKEESTESSPSQEKSKSKKPSDKSSSSTPASTATSTPSTSSTTPTVSAAKPAAKNPTYAKNLGNDGHLTPSEKERRQKDGLCLYCGGKNHDVASCPTRLARAKSTTTDPTPQPTARATVTIEAQPDQGNVTAAS